MGIKSLMRFVHQHYPLSICKSTIATIRGYRIAVDGNNLMHYVTERVERELVREHSRGVHVDPPLILQTMCNTLVDYITPLLKQDVTIIVVMDGTIPQQKLSMCYKRYGVLRPLRHITYDCALDDEDPPGDPPSSVSGSGSGSGSASCSEVNSDDDEEAEDYGDYLKIERSRDIAHVSDSLENVPSGPRYTDSSSDIS